MKKNILICKGSGEYDIIGMYLEEFAQAFCELGYTAMVWDMALDSEDLPGGLKKILEQQEIYALVDVNGGVTGENMIPEDVDVLCLSYFCDHPMYHKERLHNMRPDTVVAVLDGEHLRFLQKYYPKFNHSVFIPLGGMCREAQGRRRLSYREREMDIIFTGSYWKPQEQAEVMPGDFSGQIRKEIWEMLLSQPHLTLEEALTKVLEKHQIAVGREEMLDLLDELKGIDRDVREYFRDQIMRVLLKAGLEVYVVGNGWENLECTGREHLHILTAGAETSLHLLGDAKIVFNIMPWFKEGFQERIANGMLQGAVVVTDTSKYIEEMFEDGQDIVLFHLSRLEELPGRLRELLADNGRAEKIAERGRRKAEEEHRWSHRVGKMAEALEKVCGGSVPGGTGTIQDVYSEERISHLMREMVIKMNREIKLLNEYYGFGLLTEDYLRHVFEKLEEWNRILEREADFELLILPHLYCFRDAVFSENGGRESVPLFICWMDKVLAHLQEKEESEYIQELIYRQWGWDHVIYREQLLQFMYEKYRDSEEAELRQWAGDMKKRCDLVSYPWSLVDQYGDDFYMDLSYDASCDLIYVMHHGKRMYYPRSYAPKDVYCAYRFACMEQDTQSTHCYWRNGIDLEDGSVVIDAGVAEGNFSLDVVEKASRLYLIECDEKWFEPLAMTFRPWKDKVTLIPKMLGRVTDDRCVCVDDLAAGRHVDFIKMDVEGAEADALAGARQTLLANQAIRCVVATYHKRGMEQRCRSYLEELGFETEASGGYLFYSDEAAPVWENEFRHGLVRAWRGQ